MMFNEFECKEVDPGEFANHILDLFNSVFHRNIQMDQFSWKYLASKPEKARTWLTTKKETGEVVAAISAFKMTFFHEHREIIAYQLFDAMVKDEYRRHKIFSNTIRCLYDTLKKEGVDLCLAYGNSRSIPALNKILKDNVPMKSGHVFFHPIGLANVIQKFSLPPSIKPLFTFSLSPLYKTFCKAKISLKTSNVRFLELNKFDFVDMISMDKLKDMHILFPNRNAEYLSWKAFGPPDRIKNNLIIYAITKNDSAVGYCILSKDEKRNVLVIQSILCIDEMLLKEAIVGILRMACDLKYDGVLTNCSSKIYQEQYAKLGFVKGANVLGAINDMKGAFGDSIGKDHFWLQEPMDRDLFSY
ncbi:Acetyltransferase (GNAT) domain-containing protein [Desulfonatronum thiosulfatophilum]|uniref:Acetyltransferase (GNAT) domain-containing protein n=2 Tax=Desulfonatronum thiosulfatophilum TaxID=617002 RepID=A0A1G6EL62_9BACT|nr:Acetyltransferase (GNAT) domain-containing protein [Desulfonatronum thiosulfatophilum]